MGSGNGLMPNWQQAITWANDDPAHYFYVIWSQGVKQYPQINKISFNIIDSLKNFSNHISSQLGAVSTESAGDLQHQTSADSEDKSLGVHLFSVKDQHLMGESTGITQK